DHGVDGIRTHGPIVARRAQWRTSCRVRGISMEALGADGRLASGQLGVVVSPGWQGWPRDDRVRLCHPDGRLASGQLGAAVSPGWHIGLMTRAAVMGAGSW